MNKQKIIARSIAIRASKAARAATDAAAAAVKPKRTQAQVARSIMIGRSVAAKKAA